MKRNFNTSLTLEERVLRLETTEEMISKHADKEREHCIQQISDNKKDIGDLKMNYEEVKGGLNGLERTVNDGFALLRQEIREIKTSIPKETWMQSLNSWRRPATWIIIGIIIVSGLLFWSNTEVGLQLVRALTGSE